MICVHMGKGHRGTAATLQVLCGYCVWKNMKKYVMNFIKKFLYYRGSKAGKLMPQPLEESVPGSSIREVVHFDFLHDGADGPLGTKGVEKQGYQ